MVNQNKLFSFKTKRQTKNVFPRDVERTVDNIYTIQNLHIANSVDLDQPTHPQNLIWFCITHQASFMCKLYREQKRGGVGARSQNRDPFYSDTNVNELNKCQNVVEVENYCPGVKPQLAVRCQTSLLHFS